MVVIHLYALHTLCFDPNVAKKEFRGWVEVDMREGEVSGERKRGAEDWKMVRTRRLEAGVQKFKRT